MKTILFVVLAFLSTLIGSAQLRCLSNIDARVTATGSVFDMNKAQEIVKDFPFGKVEDFMANPAKVDAFHRIWANLDDLCLKAGNDLSANGMKGYTRFSRAAIREGDEIVSANNFTYLKDAFTKNGTFQGADFDKVMSKLADDSEFNFDPASGNFTSNTSGCVYAPRPDKYIPGDEIDSITHIFHGHLENGFSGTKGIFSKAEDVFDLIDEAFLHRQGRMSYVYDFGPGRNIGNVAGPGSNLTTKIRIVIRDGTTNVIHTAFPEG